MPTCELSNVTFHYQVIGSGPRVLFLNGSGATLESSMPLINALAKQCEVLAFDQRGLGKTSVPNESYTMANLAADAAALLDHVGWGTCAVVGISFGGMVAQEFAVTWPARVERLVLLCTSAGGDAGSSYPLHELASLPVDKRTARSLVIADRRYTPEWLAEHPLDAEMVRLRNEAASVPKSDATVKGEAMQLEARSTHNVADRLHHISCPTFVTAGRYDDLAPVKNSEEIVKRIPDATLAVYEGGHMFTAQDRQAILDIREFLATGTRP
jgi:hypothetical protein